MCFASSFVFRNGAGEAHVVCTEAPDVVVKLRELPVAHRRVRVGCRRGRRRRGLSFGGPAAAQPTAGHPGAILVALTDSRERRQRRLGRCRRRERRRLAAPSHSTHAVRVGGIRAAQAACRRCVSDAYCFHIHIHIACSLTGPITQHSTVQYCVLNTVHLLVPVQCSMNTVLLVQSTRTRIVLQF